MPTTYRVDNLRVTFPTGKIADKHPDRFATIHGTFYVGKNKLSIVSKNITVDEAKSDEFNIDMDKGILTLPSGQRGRRKAEGVSNDELQAALKNIRTK